MQPHREPLEVGHLSEHGAQQLEHLRSRQRREAKLARGCVEATQGRLLSQRGVAGHGADQEQPVPRLAVRECRDQRLRLLVGCVQVIHDHDQRAWLRERKKPGRERGLLACALLERVSSCS